MGIPIRGADRRASEGIPVTDPRRAPLGVRLTGDRRSGRPFTTSPDNKFESGPPATSCRGIRS
jgi:hypothetical protein